MTLLQRVGLWLALETAVFAQVDPGVLWTAYNDLYVGASRAKYTTAWNMFGPDVGGAAKSGALMDSALLTWRAPLVFFQVPLRPNRERPPMCCLTTTSIGAVHTKDTYR